MTTGFTTPLAGVGEDGRHLYTCPLCEAMCGLEIHVEGGRVASIRRNRDDTWSTATSAQRAPPWARCTRTRTAYGAR